MTDLLCVAAHCRILERHAPDCPGDCRGCLPRLAADGLRLCAVHTEAIGTDAIRAGQLHGELELALAGSGGGGPKVSGGGTDKGLKLNLRAVEVRDDIRATLTSWCRMIGEEKGVGLPADRMDEIGAYLHRYRHSLAAHGAAADASAELRALVSAGLRTAYPEGSGVTRGLGSCPVAEDGVVCGGCCAMSTRRMLGTLGSGSTWAWRWERRRERADHAGACRDRRDRPTGPARP